MSNQQDQIKEAIKQEYIRCAQDPVHFLKKYCYISHPIKGKILFNLYPFQEPVLQKFVEEDYIIINKSRQLGISTLVAGYALWLMIFNQDKTVLCIATKQITAANMVDKVKTMYNNLPSWLKGSKKPLEDNKLSLKLANRSQIIASSASSNSARSYSVSLLIMDEAAFIENIDKIYTAIKPTISTGGKCIALSSPNGNGNWFHQKWVVATTSINDDDGKFYPILLPWQVHPERDQAWFEKEKNNMTAKEIAQEYECDFLASGDTVVDPSILDLYEEWIKEPLERLGPSGDYWIWNYVDYSHQYILAADVARGDGKDFSAFHVIDSTTCEQVAEFKGKIGTRDFARLLVSIAVTYNNALLSVDNSSVGWDVVNEVLEVGYTNFYYSPKMSSDFSIETYTRRVDSGQTVPGFTLGVGVRPLVIGKMESYLKDKTFVFKSRRLKEELKVFIWYNGKAQAMNGYNDDLVLALGMGLYLRDTATKLYNNNVASSKAAINSVFRSTGNNPNYDKNNPFHQIINKNGDFMDTSWVI